MINVVFIRGCWMLLLLLLLLLLVLVVKLLLFPKLVSIHVVVQISIDFFVLGGDDDDAVQLVNLPTSFGVAVLYHAFATIINNNAYSQAVTFTTTICISISRTFLTSRSQPCLHCYYLSDSLWDGREGGVECEVESLCYLFYLLLSSLNLSNNFFERWHWLALYFDHGGLSLLSYLLVGYFTVYTSR